MVLSPEQALDPAEERNDADADGHCELLTEEGKRGERSDVGRLPGDDSGNETSHAICCEAVFSYLIVAVASAMVEIEVVHGESEIVAAGLVERRISDPRNALKAKAAKFERDRIDYLGAVALLDLERPRDGVIRLIERRLLYPSGP